MPIESQRYQLLSDAQSMPGLTAANSFNDVLGGILKNAYAPAMAEAEIQNKSMEHMTPLDQAYMFYSRSRDRLGDDHPTTKAAWDNYQTQLQQQKALTGFHLMQAYVDPYKAMPEDMRQTAAAQMMAQGQPLPNLSNVTQPNGSAPNLGQTAPQAQPQAQQQQPYPNQVRANILHQLLGNGPLLNQMVNANEPLPQTVQQQNRLSQGFSNEPLTIDQSQVPKIANAVNSTRPNYAIATQAQPSIIQPGNNLASQQQSIYQNQFSPQAKAQQQELGRQKVINDYTYSNTMLAAQAKSMNDYAEKSSNAASTAQTTLSLLNQLNKYTDDATIKGPLAKLLGDNISSMLDPSYAVANKNASQLQLLGIGKLAGEHPGRVLDSMNKTIMAGTPTPTMRDVALKEIVDSWKVNNQLVIGQNNLVQKFKNDIPDQSQLSTAITNYTLAHNPVKEDGSLDQSRFNDWGKVTLDEMKQYAKGMPVTSFNQQQGQSQLPSQQTRNAIQNLTGQGKAKSNDLQQWLADAKRVNPKASEQQLIDYYNKKYGTR